MVKSQLKVHGVLNSISMYKKRSLVNLRMLTMLDFFTFKDKDIRYKTLDQYHYLHLN